MAFLSTNTGFIKNRGITMDNLIGRENEIKRLDRAMAENEAQFIIVYGRRRVGKTFLINEYFHNVLTL